MIFSDDETYHDDEYITFIGITGKRYQWPFDVCRKWQVSALPLFTQRISWKLTCFRQKQEMKHLIACAHGTDSENFPIEDDHYELHNSDNYVILKEIWEKVLRPGETITMHWSPQPQFDPQRLLSPPPLPPLPPSPSPSLSEASAMSIEEPITLEDFLGPLDDGQADPSPDPPSHSSEDLIVLDVPEPEVPPPPLTPPPPPPLHPPPPEPLEEPEPQEPEPQGPEPQKEVSEPENVVEATISTPLSFKFNGKTYALPYDSCRTWHVSISWF
jgi:hypothetical protein